MKLGDMLVRDGRLSEIHLQQALQHQARVGGRIGTVLAEAGFVDFETLTIYLGLQLGIAIASGPTLDRAKQAAVRLLKPQHAAAHLCVPLVVQDRQLIMAVAAPNDVANLQAITTAIGYRVLPRIAPEARIHYYIERYYGVPRAPRFAQLGEAPRGDDDRIPTGLPSAPLPGLPPVTDTPKAAPGPMPPLRHSRTQFAVGNGSFEDALALEIDADDLLDSMEADAATAAIQMRAATPTVVAVAPVEATAPTPARSKPLSTAPAAPTPIDASGAIAALASASDRNQIAGILMRFSTKMFSAAVLFAVRDSFAFGWKSVGTLPGAAFVEHILVPLETPSILQLAIAADDSIFSGAVEHSTLHSYIYRVLDCSESQHATVGAISIGKRPVNVLYGHRPQALSAGDVAEVRDVCRAAAEAYARLIASTKRKRDSLS